MKLIWLSKLDDNVKMPEKNTTCMKSWKKIWSRLETSPRKIIGFIYTANGHVFIISKK